MHILYHSTAHFISAHPPLFARCSGVNPRVKIVNRLRPNPLERDERFRKVFQKRNESHVRNVPRKIVMRVDFERLVLVCALSTQWQLRPLAAGRRTFNGMVPPSRRNSSSSEQRRELTTNAFRALTLIRLEAAG